MTPGAPGGSRRRVGGVSRSPQCTKIKVAGPVGSGTIVRPQFLDCRWRPLDGASEGTPRAGCRPAPQPSPEPRSALVPCCCGTSLKPHTTRSSTR
eukprot:4759881-Prymnesium_polylepis.1